MVLLHAWHKLLTESRSALASTLLARTQTFHVHHGLQEEADAWASFCQRQSEALGIQCDIKYVEITDEQKRRLGVEAAAREARYQAVYSALSAGDWLLTAHHQRDQAETVCLNLMRGSGITGLQGMKHKEPIKEKRAWHWRPFLEVSVSEFERYADDNDVEWVEDPSNATLDYRRNRLRHQVLPLLAMTWPSVEKKLAQTAQWMQEGQSCLDDLAKMDLQGMSSFKYEPCGLLGFEAEYQWWDLSCLQKSTPERTKNALRYLLKNQANVLPSHTVLNEVRAVLQSSTNDSKSRWSFVGFDLRIAFNRLYLIKNPVNGMYGELSLTALSQDDRFLVNATLISKTVKLESYQQAEMHPEFKPSKRYKKWFQRNKVPVWQRASWPGYWMGERFILCGMRENDAKILAGEAFNKKAWLDIQYLGKR